MATHPAMGRFLLLKKVTEMFPILELFPETFEILCRKLSAETFRYNAKHSKSAKPLEYAATNKQNKQSNSQNANVTPSKSVVGLSISEAGKGCWVAAS